MLKSTLVHKTEILLDPSQRDDMYSLFQQKSRLRVNGLPKMGSCDRPHIFTDGYGDIIPATRMQKKNGLPLLSSRTFKLGQPHSHDPKHEYHYLETGLSNHGKNDLIVKFRKVSRDFHRGRKSKL